MSADNPSSLLKPRVGYTDLQHEPEDGPRYEIYDGEVFVVPSPVPLHQIVAANVFDRLRAYANAAGGLALGPPLDIVFSEYDVLQPDMVYFTAAQLPELSGHKPIRIPPALVVEVLSPSTESRDRGRKLQIYARFGVPEYWIADPLAKRIDVLRLQDGAYACVLTAGEDDELASATLPNLRFPVKSVFAMPI
jgi:Uma2 family endonuclease